ncbi:hypothetical protein Bca101_057952 [Brassica carinata]
MDEDTLNLSDDDRTMDQNEDDGPDPTAQSRGKKRRHSKCWNNFDIGDKLSDGTTVVVCKHCHHSYNFDLSNGITTLWRHSRNCSKTPGSTPGGSNRKFDIMVFREMIAGAIAEHNLSYSFVEYRRIREAFAYANPSIKFWCRNTAVADVFKIYENEKAHLRKVWSEVPGGNNAVQV